MTILSGLVVAILFTCAARAIALSFHWKLIHDGITMQYIGLMLLHGVLPYRDIFDMNFALTYWIHALGIMLLGKSDIATRSYDLLWCYFGAVAIAACIWRQGRAAALVAGCCFVLLHIAGGYMNQLQRDMLMVPFLVGGMYFCLCHPKPVLAGLLIGAACSIKPVAGIFALMLLLLHRWRDMPAYMVGLAIMPVLSVAWLVWLGIFAPFWDIFWHFTLPIFANSGFEDTFPFLPEIPCYGVAAIIFHVVVWRREVFSRESLLLVAGLMYGLVHYYVQRKGYGQHLYPFWAMLCLMGGVNLARLAREVPYTAWLMAGALLAAVFIWRPQSGVWNEARWFEVTPLVALSEQLEKDWAANDLPEPGSHVQIMEDVFGTAWRLAYLHDWKPAMRFMYPFVLYANKDAPVMQDYRSEFMKSLLRAPPKVILLSSNTWPQYKRVVFSEFEHQPGMNTLLKEHYILRMDSNRTKLWLRKY